MGNRRNDGYLSLREEGPHSRLAAIISFGFVASNNAVMPLNRFSFGYRLIPRDYEAKLADKLVPWINNTFNMSSVTVVLQQDGAPAHTSKWVQHFLKEQNFSWSKNMWPPFSSDVNPLNYAFWPHIEARDCNVPHPNIAALRTSIGREWMARAGTTLSKAARL